MIQPIRFKCTDVEKDWWRPISLDGTWCDGFQWDLTSTQYVLMCKRIGIPALFIPQNVKREDYQDEAT